MIGTFIIQFYPMIPISVFFFLLNHVYYSVRLNGCLWLAVPAYYNNMPNEFISINTTVGLIVHSYSIAHVKTTKAQLVIPSSLSLE